MPSTYAHFRFGMELLDVMPQENRRDCLAFKDLYALGLHGPDLLFYYHALFSNSINSIGYQMHNESGKMFLQRAACIVDSHKNQAARRAYIYGFLAHFSLDSTCHGTIDQIIRKSGNTHTEIETSFDQFLLRKDGFDPVEKDLCAHIHDEEYTRHVIAPFFPGVSEEQIGICIRSMIRSNHLLQDQDPLLRGCVRLLLKVTGNYKEMHGMLIDPKLEPLESDAVLMELYGSAKERALELISTFEEYRKGHIPVSKWARFDFASCERESL